MKRFFQRVVENEQPPKKRLKQTLNHCVSNANARTYTNSIASKKKLKCVTKTITIPRAILRSKEKKCTDYFTIDDVKENGLLIDYYPWFYSKAEANDIFNKLEKEIEYNTDEESSIVIYGKKTKIPRKQTAFGDENTSYNFSNNTVAPKKWEDVPTLLEIKQKMENTLQLKKDENSNSNSNSNKCNSNLNETFNFVLVNRYANGKDCIGFHKDDEKDLNENSSIVGISFGSQRDFVFKHESVYNKQKKDKLQASNAKIPPIYKISLQHGSMIVIRYPTNQYWYHSIPRRAKVEKARISLTFRSMNVETNSKSEEKDKEKNSSDKPRDTDEKHNCQ